MIFFVTEICVRFLAFVPEQQIPEGGVPKHFLLLAVLVMTSLGSLLGWGLAVAAKRFAVEEDPRVEEVNEVLPKGQCGACGFAGCRASI